MTQQEAAANIGQPFKLIGFTGMPWDIVQSVTADGVIEGVFIISARCEDCRLKQPQPEQLKKDTYNFEVTNWSSGITFEVSIKAFNADLAYEKAAKKFPYPLYRNLAML